MKEKKVVKKTVKEVKEMVIGAVGDESVPVVTEAPKKPVVAPVKSKKNPITYILLFKVEGHESYRMQPYQTKEDLAVYLKKAVPPFPPMLEKKWFVFDRINGTITLES